MGTMTAYLNPSRADATCLIYSSMTTVSPIVGVLNHNSCPLGYFYCDTDSTDNEDRPAGTNGFYKLIDPTTYGVDSNVNGYVKVENNLNISMTSTTAPQPLMRAASSSNATAAESNATYVDGFIQKATKAPAVNYVSVYANDATHTKEMQEINTSINHIGNIGDYTRVKNSVTHSFNRFRIDYPDMRLTKAFPYVFFTRPDLNLLNDSGAIGQDKLIDLVGANALFARTYNTDPDIVTSLTSKFTTDHDFHPFLSNAASNFDVNDESLDTFEHGETFTGWKLVYGKHTIHSKVAGTFSMSYDETPDLYVYKTHKLWAEYISKVYRGEFVPKKTYIHERRLDYAVSVYYFLCAEDGETVIFWSKYIGVFPTVIPSSALAWSKGNIIKLPEMSITYAYSFKEDMEPAALADFNINAGFKTTEDANNTTPISMLSSSRVGIGGYSFAHKPFLQMTIDKSGKYVIKLKFTNTITT